ncbi:hypothetical protein SIO70_18850 [Chitinophaga sancti]|uniref:hypothetical protein n=1 Tax=Chitinophaga sancti TaxID=1004 RepID=UPI002A752F6E|nr:hypothetical protein [Chitinophaga sancti]WPQ60409.1 hypothetical protein SIO70_18850 [Chitinophaga sancti]
MIIMRKHHFLLSCIIAITAFTDGSQQHRNTEDVSDYFEQIRHDPSSLSAFLTAMPKGADLHHHFSGAIFGETYWNVLTESNGWMQPYTIEVDTAGALHKAPWIHFATLSRESRFDSLKQAFLRKASIKDYDPSAGPSDQHFFSTFSRFGAVARYDMKTGMQEFKQRALAENVSYIETMLGAPDTAIRLAAGPAWEKSITGASLSDSTTVFNTLDQVYAALLKAGIGNTAKKFCHHQDLLHQQAAIDDSVFMLRYQLHGNRNEQPLTVYRKLLIAFQAASMDSLIVGVNLVSPEDGVISMRDYSLHMLMFAHLHRHFPHIRYSLHAGELAAGMVRPELLRYHISQAVLIAGAQRIGHGVDIAHEAASIPLLEVMRERKVAVEINLSSNEFILHVKNDQHPILFYHSHKVPIVISTDDAGVLRTDLTEQYILLATRYPSIHYNDIKAIVRNSIVYSFLQPDLKERKLGQLDSAFIKFENQVMFH